MTEKKCQYFNTPTRNVWVAQKEGDASKRVHLGDGWEMLSSVEARDLATSLTKAAEAAEAPDPEAMLAELRREMARLPVGCWVQQHKGPGFGERVIGHAIRGAEIRLRFSDSNHENSTKYTSPDPSSTYHRSKTKEELPGQQVGVFDTPSYGIRVYSKDDVRFVGITQRPLDSQEVFLNAEYAHFFADALKKAADFCKEKSHLELLVEPRVLNALMAIRERLPIGCRVEHAAGISVVCGYLVIADEIKLLFEGQTSPSHLPASYYKRIETGSAK